MTDYIYTISTAFPVGLSVSQLDAKITLDIPAFVGLIRYNISDSLTVRFVNALTGAELTTLNAIIAAHVPVASAAVQPTGSLVSFNLKTSVYRASTTIFESIGRLAWDRSRYRQFVDGVLVIDVTRFDRSLEFILYDTVVNTILSTGIVGATGVSSWPVLIPTVDSIIEMRIRKTNSGGQDPLISSVNLEFIS